MPMNLSRAALRLAGLLWMSVAAWPAAFAAECGPSLFVDPGTPAPVQAARGRFEALAGGFVPDAVIDSVLEVPIDGKSIEEVDRIITGGRAGYFTAVVTVAAKPMTDGFAQDHVSTDGLWKKTVKVTTHNARGTPIVPYLQIFYEDRAGGVIRLKPNGNSDAPKTLTHLRRAHGTKYFKLDPAGDLSYENEAFKIHERQALPKAPTQVKLPSGLTYGTPDAEAFLAQCWTYRTHVPLAAE